MDQAFTLHTGRDGLATLVFDLPGKRANVIGVEVMEELERLVAELGTRRDVECLLLLSGKAGTFIAGADVELIAQVEDPRIAESFTRRGQAVYGAWERLPFPTVAAVRGTCMGGGTELCLASTFVVVSDRPELRIGLPEVRLGILPAWGGCTRLPRRVGIAAALDMILPGKAVSGKTALKMGLADALLPDAQFLALARDFALAHRGKDRRPPERPDLKELLLERNPLGRKLLFDQARKRTLAETHGNYPAPLRAIEVVRIGIEQGRSAGLEAEARAAAELATSTVCKNLLYLFKLTEEAKKAALAPGGTPREVREVAVLGAGVMGGAIAQLIAEQAAVPVRLKDIRADALAAGMAHAADRFRRTVGRRRLTEVEARRRMALLRPTLVYHGLGACDLMIEAVVESVEVKQAVFAEAAAELPKDAVLASNTSSLSIEAIGARAPNPERVVGMHFFNPVHRMPLVEVVVGAADRGRRGGDGGGLRAPARQDAGARRQQARLPGQPPARLLHGRSAVAAARGAAHRGDRPHDGGVGDAHGAGSAHRRGGDRRRHQGGAHPRRRLPRPPAAATVGRPAAGPGPPRRQDAEGPLQV